jgi:phospholipid-binding lipoprotein MlaA
VLACAACATVQPRAVPTQVNDPWEEWNRRVFSFNESLDEHILRPIATVYADALPPIVRRGVGNFYANLADAWSAVNNLLQGKPIEAGQVAFRFGVNTVFGFAGVLDLASEMGIDRHYEDFGQTLAVWGMGPGAYLVWPILGPSTERDSLALPLNYAASPMYLFNLDLAGQFGVWSLQLVNTRAGLLSAGQILDDIALDKYTFIRDAYLSLRRDALYDGAPPMETFDDEPADVEPVKPASPPASAPSATPSAAASAASAAASAPTR